jgi:hypothetical protein
MKIDFIIFAKISIISKIFIENAKKELEWPTNFRSILRLSKNTTSICVAKNFATISSHRSFEKTYLFTKFCDNIESHRSAKPRPAITRHFIVIRMTERFFSVNPENDERLKDTIHLQWLMPAK